MSGAGVEQKHTPYELTEERKQFRGRSMHVGRRGMSQGQSNGEVPLLAPAGAVAAVAGQQWMLSICQLSSMSLGRPSAELPGCVDDEVHHMKTHDLKQWLQARLQS